MQTRTVHIIVRVTPAEKRKMLVAAKRERITFSEWARLHLMEACAKKPDAPDELSATAPEAT